MVTLVAGSAQLIKSHALNYHLDPHCCRCVARRLLGTTRSPRPTPSQTRSFASQSSGKRPKFSQRLGEALRSSKIQWYQIPVGLGVGFLGLVQFYKVSAREKEKLETEEGSASSPKRRPKVRPEGPW